MNRYHRLSDDAPNARAWADDALTIATRVGYRHLQGKSLIERGRAAWLCGDAASAEADLRTAIEIMTPLRTDLDLARAFFLLAALFHQQERIEAESVWLEAASRIISGGYAFLLEQERSLAFPLMAAYLDSDDADIVAVSETLLSHLERVPPFPLRIITLGRFEAWQKARLVDKRALNQRRAGELFRLLLVSPEHSLSRDQIIEALCPEKPCGSAQAIFHQATSALRRALEPDLPDKFPSRYLEVEEGQVTLRLPPGSSVDFAAFEQDVRDGKWEEALALYHGELYPSDRYTGWAAAPRERLAQLHIRALLAAAQERLKARRAEDALDACRHILAIEPWQETAVLVGMQACLALNDRASALRLYRDLEHALRDDLDVAPQPELQKLYQSIR
jgi:DNA-binding SARP family transcriptional activator